MADITWDEAPSAITWDDAPKKEAPGVLKRALGAAGDLGQRFAKWTGETAADAVTGASTLPSTVGAPLLGAAGAVGSYALPTVRGTLRERYDNEMAGFRRRNAEASQRSPVAHLGGALASTAALPIPAPMTAMTAGARSLPLSMMAGAGDAALLGGAANAASHADQGNPNAFNEGVTPGGMALGAAAPAIPGAADAASSLSTKVGRAAGRASLRGGTREMTAGRVKALSEGAIDKAAEVGAFRPLGGPQGQAERLQASRETQGNELGELLEGADAHGVKVDADRLASSLEAQGEQAYAVTAKQRVRDIYRQAAGAIREIAPATPVSSTRVNWPDEQNDLPFLPEHVTPGPEATRTNPGTEPTMRWDGKPLTEDRALPTSSMEETRRALDAAESHWVPGEPKDLGSPTGLTNSVGYQRSLFPLSRRPSPGGEEVTWLPGELPVTQNESIKRAYAEDANWAKTARDTVTEAAHKGVAGTMRRASEDAILAHDDGIPGVAADFVHRKQELGKTIEASNAANKGAQADLNRHGILKPYTVMMALKSLPHAAAMHGVQALPQTTAWAGYKAAGGLQNLANTDPEAFRQFMLAAALRNSTQEH